MSEFKSEAKIDLQPIIMTAKLIKGTVLREEILEEIKAEVEQIKAEHRVVPGLVTILVGANAASLSYVTPQDQDGPSGGLQRSAGKSAGRYLGRGSA